MKTRISMIALKNLGRLGAVALIAAAVGLAGCKTSSSDRTMGQKMSDRQVAKEVKKGLSQDPTFKYSNVQPIVYNGTVQLTGFVETPEQRLRAAEIAAKARGAHQVINEVMIRTTPTGPVTIRDPLGHEAGHLMVDTNAPVPQLRNLPADSNSQQPAQQPK